MLVFWSCPLRFHSSNRIVLASGPTVLICHVYSVNAAALLLQHLHSTLTALCNGCLAGVWPLGESLCRAEGWLTSELVAMADEDQATFSSPTGPRCHSPSPCSALFWAYTTRLSNNSRTGSYSPVQPLITSAGRLVGQAAAERWNIEQPGFACRAARARSNCSLDRSGAGHCPPSTAWHAGW